MRASLMTTVAAVLTSLLFAAHSDAAPRRGASISGDSFLGFGLSLVTSNQKDLGNISDGLAANYPGTWGMKSMGSAYEFYGQYGFRFSGTMFGLIFRPSYFTQSTDGGCGTSSCSIKLNGLTLFPILRLVPLENSFIKFFMQAGIGWGTLKTEVKEGSASASFSGSGYGTLAGIGTDFCFTETHCLTIEGNIRYLPIERNTYDSQSGTFSNGGFSNSGSSEVERSNNDVGTTMSGIQGVIAYTLNF